MHIKDIETLDQFAEAVNLDELTLKRRMELGGAQGGSCWGGEACGYTVSNPQMEPDKAIVTILETVFPEMTFLEFRRMETYPIYEKRNYSRTEYYGNYTQYESHELLPAELLIALKEIWASRAGASQ